MSLFTEVSPASASTTAPAELDHILRLPVQVVVRLASKHVPLATLLRMGDGAVLEFDKHIDDPLELLVNNQVVAAGQAVEIGDRLGLRIAHAHDVRARVKALGGR